MLSEYRGIPREARLLVFLSFIPSVAIGFIYFDLVYFLTVVQGIPSPWPGVIASVMGLTLVAESIPMGLIADRIGKRKMLIVGNLCASLSLLGFALTKDITLILIIAVLEGTGEAAFSVSTGALLAEKAGDEKRTPAFSLLAFLSWIAGAIGGFVLSSIYLFQGIGLNVTQAHVALYAIIALLNLSVTPLLFFVKEGMVTKNRRSILPRKSGRVLIRYLAYSATIALGAGLFVTLMPYWFSLKFGVPDGASGPILGFTNLLTAGVVVMSPMLARRLGLVKATVITQASSMIFMVLIPSSPSFGVAASFYVVRVFLMNLSNPLTQSLIMGLVSPEERGMASGITAALWRLPNSLSNAVGFVLMKGGYLALPFYLATVLYAIGISIFWFLFKDASLPEERSRNQAPAQSSSLDGPDDTL